MRKFEYKFVKISLKLGFDYDKKIRELERQWNELGEEGWQFCWAGDGVLVFMREKAP